ncbi:MAG: response regulator [Thermochromatium sp.]
MPGGLDGLQTLKEMRNLRRLGLLHGEPPALIVSAYRQPMVADREGLYSAFLSKPVTASTLLEAMRQAISPLPPQGQDVEGGVRRIPCFSQRTLLLVEDNALNREVATAILAKTRIKIVVAHNGQEALEQVARVPVDLVLMDLQMPVMDGFEATRRIRARHPQLPIIALSAAVMEADREQALQAGANDHLAKPITVQAMFAMLEKWLPAEEGCAPLAPDMDPAQTCSSEGDEVIDSARALRAFDGDQALYQRTLQLFKEQLATECAPLFGSLDDLEPSVKRRLLHTLKGLAGTAGAQTLADAAARLEAHVRHGEPIPQSEQQDFAQALVAVRDRLSVSLSPSVAPDHSDPPDTPQSIAPLLSELLQSLSAGELVDEALLTRVTDFIQSQGEYAGADELRRFVDLFEHDQAMTVLRTLAERMGIKLANV